MAQTDPDALAERVRSCIQELDRISGKIQSINTHLDSPRGDTPRRSPRRSTGASSGPREERFPPPTGKVTLVFTDVQSSTELWELFPVEMAEAISIHNEEMRNGIDKFNGYEVKTEGDAFMVAFHDAIDAVQWCLFMQQRLLQLPWPQRIYEHPSASVELTQDEGGFLWRGLRVRMGAHVGYPTPQRDPKTQRMDYFGQMVNRAARVGGVGKGGQIVVSEEILDEIGLETLVALRAEITALGPRKMKGVQEPMLVHSLLSLPLSGRKFPQETVGNEAEPMMTVHLRPEEFEGQAHLRVVLDRIDCTVITAYMHSGEKDLGEVEKAATELLGAVATHFQIGPEDIYGAPLSVPLPISQPVTVVCCDVPNIQDLWRNLPDEMTVAIRLYMRLLRETLQALGGSEGLADGDAVAVCFSHPQPALQWCLRVQTELLEVAWPTRLLEHPLCAQETAGSAPYFRGLRCRMGAHVGPIEIWESEDLSQPFIAGRTVDSATSIASVAQPGQILVSGELLCELATEQQNGLVMDIGTQWLPSTNKSVRLYSIVPSYLRGRRFSVGALQLAHPIISSDRDILSCPIGGPRTQQALRAILLRSLIYPALASESEVLGMSTSQSTAGSATGTTVANGLEAVARSLHLSPEDVFGSCRISLLPPPTGVITLVFTDVQSSTALWEYSTEAMKTAIFLHNEEMRDGIDKFNGYEVKTEGDAFMIAFSNSVDAVRWSLSMQERLLTVNWPEDLYAHPACAIGHSAEGQLLWRGLRVRMGAHHGAPFCATDPVTGRMDYFGPMVNRAARVASVGHGGQIVLAEGTLLDLQRYDQTLGEIIGHPVLTNLGARSLKGVPGQTTIYSLVPRALQARDFPTADPPENVPPPFSGPGQPRVQVALLRIAASKLKQSQVEAAEEGARAEVNMWMQEEVGNIRGTLEEAGVCLKDVFGTPLRSAESSDKAEVVVVTELADAHTLWEQHPEDMARTVYLHNSGTRTHAQRFGGRELRSHADRLTLAFPNVTAAYDFSTGLSEALAPLPWPSFFAEPPALRTALLHNPAAEADTEAAVLDVLRRAAPRQLVASGGFVSLKFNSSTVVTDKVYALHPTSTTAEPTEAPLPSTSSGHTANLGAYRELAVLRHLLALALRGRLRQDSPDLNAEDANLDSELVQRIRGTEREVTDAKAAFAALGLSDPFGSPFISLLPAPVGHIALSFTDVQSSTELWERFTGSMQHAIALHNDVMRAGLEKYRGYEVKTEGDAFMASFYDSADASRWCVHMQTSLLAVDWPAELFAHPSAAVGHASPNSPEKQEKGQEGTLIWRGLRVRMGVHCGVPLSQADPNTGRMDYFGPMVNKAARVSGLGHGGQIVASEDTIGELHRLAAVAPHNGDLGSLLGSTGVIVTSLGERALKGISRPVTVYSLQPFALRGRRFPTPEVGCPPPPPVMLFDPSPAALQLHTTRLRVHTESLLSVMRAHAPKEQEKGLHAETQRLLDVTRARLVVVCANAEKEARRASALDAERLEALQAQKEAEKRDRVMQMEVQQLERIAGVVRDQVEQLQRETARREELEAEVEALRLELTAARSRIADTQGWVASAYIRELAAAQTLMPGLTTSSLFGVPTEQTGPPPNGRVCLAVVGIPNVEAFWAADWLATKQVVSAHNAQVRVSLVAYSGHEAATDGDAFLLAFFTPLDAARWAISFQQEQLLRSPRTASPRASAFSPRGSNIRPAIALHVGTVMTDTTSGSTTYTGRPVTALAQISRILRAGDTILSYDVMQDLERRGGLGQLFPEIRVRPLGQHAISGAGPLSLYNLLLPGVEPAPASPAAEGIGAIDASAPVRSLAALRALSANSGNYRQQIPTRAQSAQTEEWDFAPTTPVDDGRSFPFLGLELVQRPNGVKVVRSKPPASPEVLINDVIIAIDSISIKTMPEFRQAVHDLAPGQPVAVTVTRRTHSHPLDVIITPARKVSDSWHPGRKKEVGAAAPRAHSRGHSPNEHYERDDSPSPAYRWNLSPREGGAHHHLHPY